VRIAKIGMGVFAIVLGCGLVFKPFKHKEPKEEVKVMIVAEKKEEEKITLRDTLKEIPKKAELGTTQVPDKIEPFKLFKNSKGVTNAPGER